ncbi:sterol desaturase family protein [Legionella resiliens]|uniref:Sterol desaturase family protein n=1 Tax=Legionella resiliens TaxID=2905958 RepID=A0ABS8X1L0_9GAMM|nr:MULTISPECIES: sterol desaturase family protein [unclassified Legionella]MCE0721814.1 sterol desaturase family protein [Legionella sp. 9fVS26]MCE3530968.1 sterol desaturase family protein [Legionella sp. 8cVS16]
MTGIFIAAGFALILFFLERIFPLRKRKRGMLSRLTVNSAVSITTFTVAFLLIRPTTSFFLGWTASTPFGVMRWFRLTGLWEVLFGFLLLDLSFYYWHIANHKIPFLWRFHNVHHIDPDLDVSTGFRFHPGEVALSTFFRAIQVALIGVSASTFVIYEVLFQMCTFFHHSNLRLPLRLERVLNLIFVTPRMHGIHHSNFRKETDSNYSVVFSVWDRLHRTIGLGIPQQEIDIGVPGYTKKRDNYLKQVLILPFVQQQEYWRDESGHNRISRGEERRRRTQWLVE